MSTNIGIDVKEPEGTCDDENCPFHGNLSVRGSVIEGKVASVIDDKSVVVEIGHTQKAPKYERYEKRSSRITAHKPPCLEVNEKQAVKIAECRPISKAKSYVLVEGGEE